MYKKRSHCIFGKKKQNTVALLIQASNS